MHPPLDVPSAPPSSSTYSRAMPCSRIAVLSKAVFAPGSPEASIGVGRGSPSLCRLIWKILHQGVRSEERGPTVIKRRTQARATKMIFSVSCCSEERSPVSGLSYGRTDGPCAPGCRQVIVGKPFTVPGSARDTPRQAPVSAGLGRPCDCVIVPVTEACSFWDVESRSQRVSR